MSKQPEIDQIFQSRLYDAQAEPPAFVWANVEKALHRKRRRAVFWILSSFLLLGSAGLWAWWNGRVHSSNTISLPQPSTPVATTSASSSNTNAAILASPATGHENTQLTSGAAVSPEANHGSAAKVISSVARKSNRQASLLPDQHQTGTNSPASKKGAQTTTSLETGNMPTTEGEPSLPIGTIPNQDAVATETPPQTVSATQTLTSLSVLEPEWLQTKQANAQIKQIKIARGKRTKKYKNCYDFASHSKVFLLDGYVGLSAVRKDLRIGLPESTPYRDQREATERNSWAFNGGMRGSMLFNQNFLVRGGIHYDQLTEIFEYKDPNYKKVEYIFINGVFVDSLTTYGSNFIKTYNRFGMLEIPLEAGFEMRKLRSGISIQLGASFNVLFWKRGKIMTPSDIPASIDPDDNAYNTFKSNLGVSVIGSVQWFYHIRPTLRVFAEPYYRHILRPVTISSHPLEQRYGIGGVRLGLTKILN